MGMNSPGARYQYRGLFPETILFTVTGSVIVSDPGNQIITASGNVPGAEFGDLVLVAPNFDVEDLQVFGQVVAADQVGIYVTNNGAGAKNLGSQTFYGVVMKTDDGLFRKGL